MKDRLQGWVELVPPVPSKGRGSVAGPGSSREH